MEAAACTVVVMDSVSLGCRCRAGREPERPGRDPRSLTPAVTTAFAVTPARGGSRSRTDLGDQRREFGPDLPRPGDRGRRPRVPFSRRRTRTRLSFYEVLTRSRRSAGGGGPGERSSRPPPCSFILDELLPRVSGFLFPPDVIGTRRVQDGQHAPRLSKAHKVCGGAHARVLSLLRRLHTAAYTLIPTLRRFATQSSQIPWLVLFSRSCGFGSTTSQRSPTR